MKKRSTAPSRALRWALALSCACGTAPLTAQPAPDANAPVVVLLHGLARTPRSMERLATALEAEGWRVCNIAYPSRAHPVEVLAREHVQPAVVRCVGASEGPVHFVTHSLGGIVVRQLAATEAVPRMGRVVMLGPPNHGSEVVDRLGGWALFRLIGGPAVDELGTTAQAMPHPLGPATFEVGVLTGDRSINWVLSALIPGADDGKVSVESARLEGMKDFAVVHATHPFITYNGEAIRQTLQFLRHGRFGTG